jgi:lipopolysaccharide export system protein LptC
MWFRTFTLLAVLALGVSTWFLSSPSRRPQFNEGDDAQLPGYFLNDAVLTDYDASGAPAIRIDAKRIEQVAHGNDIALFDVKVDYRPPEGESWRLVGDTGHIERGSKIVDVQGNVRLQGEASGPKGFVPVVHTDALRYDIDKQIVSTHDDVQVDFGPNTVTAHGMSANLKDRTMRLEYKVHGTFHP